MLPAHAAPTPRARRHRAHFRGRGNRVPSAPRRPARPDSRRAALPAAARPRRRPNRAGRAPRRRSTARAAGPCRPRAASARRRGRQRARGARRARAADLRARSPHRRSASDTGAGESRCPRPTGGSRTSSPPPRRSPPQHPGSCRAAQRAGARRCRHWRGCSLRESSRSIPAATARNCARACSRSPVWAHGRWSTSRCARSATPTRSCPPTSACATLWQRSGAPIPRSGVGPRRAILHRAAIAHLRRQRAWRSAGGRGAPMRFSTCGARSPRRLPRASRRYMRMPARPVHNMAGCPPANR